LLLAAVPHNPDAVRACIHLAAIPSPAPSFPATPAAGASAAARGRSHSSARYSAEELRRQHDEEHGNVGLSVPLKMEDLERLHLVLQPPQGGGIDDPPLKIGEYIFQTLYRTVPPPTATLPIGDVEREIRRHLELELLMAGVDPDDKESDDEEHAANAAASALAKLSLGDHRHSHPHHLHRAGGATSGPSSSSHPSSTTGAPDADSDRAKLPHLQYQKELSYTHLRAQTILLKPNPPEAASSGASSASGGEPNPPGSAGGGGGAPGGRLHDLAISDCSDAHFYLLQPFEHATISACTGCTIVVGAVAGLLHVVDCEKTNITAAGRRILVSNSCDVQLFVFTPSPPLLVGDNRSCQFAPYNTYYDGLREDLLATGLAAAVLPESQSPYHGGRMMMMNPQESAFDAAWPPLQCASNKWKHPIELAKLEVPQVAAPGGSTSPPTTPGAPSGAAAVGADEARTSDATMMSPILMPASEFHILFVPVESDAARQRRLELEESDEGGGGGAGGGGSMESQYCVLLAEILQLSPFRLPVEFERRVLVKAERMRHIQQAVKKNLNEEQQQRFEEELNRGFREWLVQSGNLRQVLDLVHLERRGGT
jgi:TBCC domain-containing protein 1